MESLKGIHTAWPNRNRVCEIRQILPSCAGLRRTAYRVRCNIVVDLHDLRLEVFELVVVGAFFAHGDDRKDL